MKKEVSHRLSEGNNIMEGLGYLWRMRRSIVMFFHGMEGMLERNVAPSEFYEVLSEGPKCSPLV